MDPEALHSLIIAWQEENELTSFTDFRACFDPHNDPQDDYRIVYEAVLEPASEDRMRIEIWLTDAARIAIGIETKRRLAHRLGLRALRSDFAAGHEPQSVSQESLRELLGIVANGFIGIRFLKLFGVLVRSHAVTSEINYSMLANRGYQNLRWIEPSTDFGVDQHGLFQGVADYKPWKSILLALDTYWTSALGSTAAGP